MILSMMTKGSCGPTCVVWLKSCVFLKSKLGLFVGPHNVHAREICLIQHTLILGNKGLHVLSKGAALKKAVGC